LPAIWADPHVAGGEAVLALKVIDVGPVDEINAVDEELRSPYLSSAQTLLRKKS
jgi:hypothetical protein